MIDVTDKTIPLDVRMTDDGPMSTYLGKYAGTLEKWAEEVKDKNDRIVELEGALLVLVAMGLAPAIHERLAELYPEHWEIVLNLPMYRPQRATGG